MTSVADRPESLLIPRFCPKAHMQFSAVSETGLLEVPAWNWRYHVRYRRVLMISGQVLVPTSKPKMLFFVLVLQCLTVQFYTCTRVIIHERPRPKKKRLRFLFTTCLMLGKFSFVLFLRCSETSNHTETRSISPFTVATIAFIAVIHTKWACVGWTFVLTVKKNTIDRNVSRITRQIEVGLQWPLFA